MSILTPIKYPAKFYSWQDKDAPVLEDKDGVIKTILKACLVTGYGEKEGAGWQMLADDDSRLLLNRPLQVGNPPTLKIENGVIDGQASHRIVAQNNPTGLDDTSEQFAVNLLSRDKYCGQEWHLFVTDFAFLLCYQMGDNKYEGNRNTMLYVGEMIGFQDNDFVISDLKATAGYNTVSTPTFLACRFVGKKTYTITNYIHQSPFIGDYAQRIILDNVGMLPFYMSLFDNNINKNTDTYTVNMPNPMLVWVNAQRWTSGNKPQKHYYIPTDYWEL